MEAFMIGVGITFVAMYLLLGLCLSITGAMGRLVGFTLAACQPYGNWGIPWFVWLCYGLTWLLRAVLDVFFWPWTYRTSLVAVFRSGTRGAQ